ncbi:hypothetical protein MYA98_24235 [Salmonella sp. WGH-01]|nr:hypothetical protein MYA98_24235 [Salmonella sp. WGH-01]
MVCRRRPALFCGFRRDDCRYDPEPIPATAISFIAVTICVIGSNYLLFDASELADPAFKASKQALKWGLPVSPAPRSGWFSARLFSRWATK